MKLLYTLFFLLLLTFNITAQDFNNIAEMEKQRYAKYFETDEINYPGDPEIDALYYKLEIEVQHIQENIIGRTTAKLKANSNITTFFLDLIDQLNIDSVKMGDDHLAFVHSDDKINITLDREYTEGEEFTVDVFYYGNPNSSGFGSFTFATHNGDPIISTLSEPYGTRDWWACKDTPADKADSCDVWVTCSTDLIPVSNGMLEDVIDNGDGTHTYKWGHNYPIAQYLISLAITNYIEYTNYFHYTENDSMPIDHYIYPEHFNSIKNQLDETPQMLEALSSRYSLYPFIEEKYGHAEFSWGGAMEHQTISSMGSGTFNDGTMVHELAHQWYGDKVTCANWHHIWLNEGFATYSEAVYYEAINDMNRYNAAVSSMLNSGRNAQGSIYVEDISSVNQIFNYYRSYLKGGAVLHMLRGVLGDSTFFQVMKAYANDPELAYNSATTEDFQQVAEDVSGEDLDYFFQEWIYGENYPRYNVIWGYDYLNGNSYEFHIDINQDTNSDPAFFTMPIQIKVNTTEGDTLFTIFNDQQVQSFAVTVEGEPVSFQFDPNKLIMKTISVTTGVKDEILPFKYSLEQNYPNPFNPATTIKYSLAEETNVQLKIFDILGNEVAELVNERKSPGKYNVEFDASDLSSGVYFYKLNAGNFSSTKKLILQK